MTTNKKRFLSLVAEQDNSVLRDIEKRIKNRSVLTESKRIATKVLLRLDELDWTQKDLANAMGVKPQQITKIVKGQQNLTLDTIVRLQEILRIPILASWRHTENKMSSITYTKAETVENIPKIHDANIRAYMYKSIIQISGNSIIH